MFDALLQVVGQLIDSFRAIAAHHWIDHSA